MTHASQKIWIVKPGMLWDGMGSILTRQRLTAALIALFVAVLVLVPSVDAVACSAELDPPAAAEMLDGGPTESEGVGVPHGICSHGHCHHVGTEVTGAPDVEVSASTSDRVRAISGDDLLASRVPAGLERPPRV